MSAFAVVYERLNSSADPIMLERVLGRLQHRDVDGRDVFVLGNVAMGHIHFWTTPEEVGERQPLAIKDEPFRIVFDGRIDNRDELFLKLNLQPDEGNLLSDAQLMLHAYARWNENCFKFFVGEFSLVIFDEINNQLVCARDHLGDRTLFYTTQDTQVVIASEPWAVAGVNNSKPDLNEKAIAHYFALQATEDGQTFFNNVYELLPAHVMTIDVLSQRMIRYWKPDMHKKIRYKTDEEYAEHFRKLLEESVRCRMRSNAPVGVLMSGGLDSTSVACLAARMKTPQQLTTISFVFDELADCDEREYINAVKEQWQTHSIQIPCDDAWTYKGWESWKRNPNQPEGNPYRLVKERVYQRASHEGLRVLLTGGFGDHLYDGLENWLLDLILDNRIKQAVQGVLYNIRNFGVRQALKAPSARRLARFILDKIPVGRYLHAKHTSRVWLTSFSLENINPKPVDRAFEDKHNLLGLPAAKSSTGEIYNANRYKLELRHPYRDRRLIEFILAVPAYQLYFCGVYKYILRSAMQGILPEIIRIRRQKTSLVSLLSRGIEREKNSLQELLQAPNARWRKFVEASWLLPRWNVQITPDTDGPQALIPWLCLSFEAW